ncbi:MAG: hypothetical protein QGH94_00985 [Phycisphaerae bacterium]|jgi:hypothetical protein|nr:hypothetical protein [Phycisphaerae bacterium]
MIRTLTITALLLSLTLLTGCGPSDPHEKAVADQIGCMEDITGVLGGVKDGDTAAAAVPKIKAIGERMAQIAKRKLDLGSLDADKAKALAEKYGKRLGELKGQIAAETAKQVLRVDVVAAVANAMKHVISD